MQRQSSDGDENTGTSFSIAVVCMLVFHPPKLFLFVDGF